MENIRERAVANHLKEHRPKMYQELVRTGQLEATVRRMWEEHTDLLHELTVNRKLPYDQAMELARETAFPPSEKDQPRLGENPSGPTSVETTS
jgi:hypothetical protein